MFKHQEYTEWSRASNLVNYNFVLILIEEVLKMSLFMLSEAAYILVGYTVLPSFN